MDTKCNLIRNSSAHTGVNVWRSANLFPIFLTEITAALNSHRVRGLYFQVVIFAATIVNINNGKIKCEDGDTDSGRK